MSTHSPLPAASAPATDRDPVCGMTVQVDSQHRAEHGGREYLFCGAGCKRKFEVDPERYLHGTGTPVPHSVAAPTNDEALYTCPMHPEVRQHGPGACPKCGMALEPVQAAAPATKVEWTCPMHPQIVRDGPGSCPICGMALEPRTASLDKEENPELVDMRRRFFVSAALAAPLLLMMLGAV